MRVSISLIAALIATPAVAQVGAPLPKAKLGPVDWSAPSFQGLDRAYYFGGDNHHIGSERERYVDPTYCPAPDPILRYHQSGFKITARLATDQEREACHLKPKEQYLSGLITTQHAFSTTYGYWVIRATLPEAPASWPAFWLLPTEKTAANAGSVPEIDVLEEYAGVMHLPHANAAPGQSEFKMDRTGYPISTLHLAGGKVLSGGQTVHVEPGTWHTYGLLWEPTRVTFYVDDAETWSADVTISDPHYMLLNLAVDGRPYLAKPGTSYPASFTVDWVRHYPLLGGSSAQPPSHAGFQP